MHKKALLILLVIVTLMSCSTNKKRYVIAVSSCSNDMWREKLNEELITSSYLYNNVKLKIQSANDDDKLQSEQINRFIDEGVDLLIVSPNQLKTISPVINRAYERRIPVVLFDRKTDTNRYTAFIGADNYKVGRDMGEYVARLMKGRGHLVVIKGLEGSSPTIERDSGFMSVIKGYKDIEVVGSVYGDWLYKKAAMGMDSLLRHTQDIDCVFAQNDRMALGARNAVKAKGITRHIDYVGVDALPQRGGGIECVDNGMLTASYIYPTRGDLVMRLAMNILLGRTFERENNLSGALVTKDNAHVLMLQSDELNSERSQLYKLHDRVNIYLAQYSHQRIYTMFILLIIILLTVSFLLIYRYLVVRRKKAEEAADAKLTFFANVSHEFRTPLTLIADPVDRLMADQSLTESQTRLLKIVRQNVDAMLKLVSEILDFRKMQKGKMKLRLTRFDLSASLQEWTDRFRFTAERKEITLETDILPNINIVADKERVEEIVINLFSNALKYTEKGGNITLRAYIDDRIAVIAVADDGCGMTADEARHAFDRFYQAGSKFGGTGIGLALVKAYTELHHGKATVESTPNKGSTFTIMLPMEQQGCDIETSVSLENSSQSVPLVADDTALFAKEPTNADRITDPNLQFGQKPIALVIDDNANMRAYIAEILRYDYEVLLSSDGSEGVQRAIKEVPDIVISDVMMPQMDGLELCRRLKNETTTSHIPVILLTARAMDNYRADGYDSGADAYITKPFTSRVLTSRIKNLLETRHRLKQRYSEGNIVDEKVVDADSKFMHDFNRIILSHIADSKLSVEDVAAEMSLSRVQMYRKVKALTGKTPVELIRMMRLKRAERLLKQGGRTVSEVAYEVGFSSPSYFAKCFREQFGRLPSD